MILINCIIIEAIHQCISAESNCMSGAKYFIEKFIQCFKVPCHIPKVFFQCNETCGTHHNTSLVVYYTILQHSDTLSCSARTSSPVGNSSYLLKMIIPVYNVAYPTLLNRRCLEPRWFVGDPTSLARDNIFEDNHCDRCCYNMFPDVDAGTLTMCDQHRS